jgi:ferritin
VLSKKLEDALNDQINAEYHSGYLYLSMAAYFEALNLDGCGHWMRMQTQEEIMHGMKIFDYVNSRAGRVLLATVEGPPTEWESPLDAFQAALEHEKKMTSRINDLAQLAQKENDHATNNLMQWFVNEQVEEEATVDNIVQKLKLLGTEGPGLYMLDRELNSRVFTPETGAEAGA